MRKTIVGMFVFAMMAACGPSPSQVAESFTTAMNAKNLDQVAALLAPTATMKMNGKAMNNAQEIRTALQSLVDQNVAIEVAGQRQIAGENVSWTEKVTTDEYKKLNVAPVEAEVKMTVQGGKIASVEWALNAESTKKIQTAKNDITKKVVTDLAAALNAHNNEAVLALFQNTAAVTYTEKKYNGAADIKGWLDALTTDAAGFEVAGEPAVAENKVTLAVKATTNEWKGLNVAPLDATVEAIVDNGKVSRYTLTLTPEAAAKLQTAATAKPAGKAKKGG